MFLEEDIHPYLKTTIEYILRYLILNLILK